MEANSEPTLLVYREEPRRRPEPEPVLEVSEAETVKELMGKVEWRVMRELLAWVQDSSDGACLGFDGTWVSAPYSS